VAERSRGGSSLAEDPHPGTGKFDRDTAVSHIDGSGAERTYSAQVSPDWRAGRGPHGGYIAAMLLRALVLSVDDSSRAPRSLTVHYPSAPEPGPVQIHTRLERSGRSLSTLSARMVQDGRLTALVLAAFSPAWSGLEVAEVEMPKVAPPDPDPGFREVPHPALPPIAQRTRLQRRFGGPPFAGEEQAMEIGGWLAHEEARPLDALSLAFFADAVIPAPFMRLTTPNPAPTIDLSVHFRAVLPHVSTPSADGRAPAQGGDELCLLRIRTGLIHEGFFEEDGLMWAPDGTLLAQSRQLAILLPS
jgi:acyl-CoA thioesterase